MIITTGDSTAAPIIERARELAKELHCRYLDRRKQSLPQLAKRYGDEHFLVLLNDRTRYVWIGHTDLTYHPSMGFIRSKRLLAGEGDTMITASRVEPGDVVLDCTAGLGSDSIVFATAVGDQGRVDACESQFHLYALVREGLRSYESDVPAINEAMRRVHMHRDSHETLLTRLPDRSVDIVYFDPMFRTTIEESAHMDPLRQIANHEAIKESTIQEARRVARKTIVMKELNGSKEFERLGFERVVWTKNSKLAYGVIDIGNIGNKHEC